MILVTGATGCIGSNITRTLVRRGEEVAVLRKPDDDAAAIADVAEDVQHRFGDVRNADSVEQAMRGVTHVYHLAGVTLLKNDLADLLYDVNVHGTENIARSALLAGARVVHTSSEAAIGFPMQEPRRTRTSSSTRTGMPTPSPSTSGSELSSDTSSTVSTL